MQETETVTTIMIDGNTEEEAVIVEESNQKLHTQLQEIRKMEGVLGYIVKDDSTATVDLAEPERKVEFALLSSQTLESAVEMQEIFSVGDIGDVVASCGDLKVLCFTVDDCIVSVFMDKTVDHNEVAAAIRES